MSGQYDTIVIGGGAMGLATAWHLTLAGQRPLLLERFAPGHHEGASHGETRNYNNAYSEPPFLALLDEALPLWRALESASDSTLLTLWGLTSHGDPQAVHAAHAALLARNSPAQLLTPSQAQHKFRGMRFDGDVLLSAEAGIIHAERALRALAELATSQGAEIRRHARVTEILDTGSGVQVTFQDPHGDTQTVRADHAVITAGAWTEHLIGSQLDLPPLVVTEEQPAHFAVLDSGAAWPSFNHFAAETAPGRTDVVYGMLTPGEGVKVGLHLVGPTVDPDARSYQSDPELHRMLRAYVAEWLPGLDPTSYVDVSCTYTSTPSERFVLDTVGAITVGAGFSGQGFKFVPAIGRILADTARGVSRPPAAFRLAAHHAG